MNTILDEINSIIEAGYRSQSYIKKDMERWAHNPLIIEYRCGSHNGIDMMLSMLEDLRSQLGGKKPKDFRSHINGYDFYE